MRTPGKTGDGWLAFLTVDNEGADDPVEVAGLSADGRYVAYASPALNLVARDRNSIDDVFLFDRLTGRTTRASVRSDGGESVLHHGSMFAAISPDGRFVGWHSDADDLVAGDRNRNYDVFLRGPLR